MPPPSLLVPLSRILSRPNPPLGPLPWQHVAISALSLLTSASISEAVPEQVDDIIITSLPLLFVHRRGNKLAGCVASVLCTCGVEHALLAEITESDGKEVGGTLSQYYMYDPHVCVTLSQAPPGNFIYAVHRERKLGDYVVQGDE